MIVSRMRKVKGRFNFRFSRFRLFESEDGKSIIGKGDLKIVGMNPYNAESLDFFVGERQCKTVIENIKSTKWGGRCTVRLTMGKEEIFTLPIHNVLKVRFVDREEGTTQAGVMFDGRLPFYVAIRE